jgi:hypothetical protein
MKRKGRRNRWPFFHVASFFDFDKRGAGALSDPASPATDVNLDPIS